MARLVLAATLSTSYGIYGPVFELCESKPKEPGSEEYLNSEKYELKHWDIMSQNSLKDFIATVNNIRHQNIALQSNEKLEFHTVDNDQIICYSKCTKDFSNIILTIVNLDYNYAQSGWTELSLSSLKIPEHHDFKVYDLLNNKQYTWNGPRNYIELKPNACPAHIFRINSNS